MEAESMISCNWFTIVLILLELVKSMDRAHLMFAFVNIQGKSVGEELNAMG